MDAFDPALYKPEHSLAALLAEIIKCSKPNSSSLLSILGSVLKHIISCA